MKKNKRCLELVVLQPMSFQEKDKFAAGLRYEGEYGDGIHDNTSYLQLTYRFFLSESKIHAAVCWLIP